MKLFHFTKELEQVAQKATDKRSEIILNKIKKCKLN